AALDAAESGCVGSGTSPGIQPTMMASGFMTGDFSFCASSLASSCAAANCAVPASLAPAILLTCAAAASSSVASTTSAKTMVTLSGPPERSASSTKRVATSSKDPVKAAFPMVDALPGSDKPSEHNKMRSPGCASNRNSVGCTSRPL